MKLVSRLLQIFHAIGLGKHAPPIEGVDVQLLSWVLISTEKVAWEADAGDGQSQAPAHCHVQHTHGNGITGVAVDHSVEVAGIGTPGEG